MAFAYERPKMQQDVVFSKCLSLDGQKFRIKFSIFMALVWFGQQVHFFLLFFFTVAYFDFQHNSLQ